MVAAIVSEQKGEGREEEEEEEEQERGVQGKPCAMGAWERRRRCRL